jgi:phospholipid/cholesterol/gamma-HCH transport system substrate-binding protein
MNGSQRYRRQRILLGGVVLLAVALFLFSLIQGGALREWFDPSKYLRLVLPDDGLYGLAEGAKIEILGTPAGKVLQIVIDPKQKIHAEARIDSSMAPFVRRDSRAIIRKTFGVAGESYLEITRGYGEPMDWEYAVLTAQPDRAPTESIGEMLEDVRSRVMPILDQAARAITALADLTEKLAAPDGSLQVILGDISTLTTRMQEGEGSLGRLLANDKAVREFEALLGNTNETVSNLRPILEELQTAAEKLTALSGTINAQSQALPEISAKVNSVLDSLDHVMRDLRATSPQLPEITRDLGTTAASVPVMMGMTQQTLAELETLLRQLRGHWLFGGSGTAPPDGNRLSPREVRP